MLSKLRHCLYRSVMLRISVNRLLDPFKRDRHRTFNTDLGELLSKYPGMEYDEKDQVFILRDTRLRLPERMSIRRQLMQDLKLYAPQHKIRVSDVDLDYYDKCLVKYLENVEKRGMVFGDACWHRYAQRNKAVGTIEVGETSEQAKSRFLSMIKSLGKDGYTGDQLFAEEGFIYFRNDNPSGQEGYPVLPEKVLKLYHSIFENGWRHPLSELSPIVIGASEITGKYHMITGRHRMACLQFLQSQERLPLEFTVKCHLVRYPYDTLVTTRAYFEICKQCRWNEVITTEPGTHQDFSVAKGFVAINSREARDKWRLISPVFDNIVRNRSVLDIGAYRGLYCFKALEHGARTVTALDIDQGFLDNINRFVTHVAEENLHTLLGDFYDEKTFGILESHKHEIALLFGVIHHLLRLGIQKNELTNYEELLARVARLARAGAIIEFSEPREHSLNLPEIRPFRDEFKRDRFIKGLKRHFGEVRCLGKCKYRPNRFIYYALK